MKEFLPVLIALFIGLLGTACCRSEPGRVTLSCVASKESARNDTAKRVQDTILRSTSTEDTRTPFANSSSILLGDVGDTHQPEVGIAAGSSNYTGQECDQNRLTYPIPDPSLTSL